VGGQGVGGGGERVVGWLAGWWLPAPLAAHLKTLNLYEAIILFIAIPSARKTIKPDHVYTVCIESFQFNATHTTLHLYVCPYNASVLHRGFIASNAAPSLSPRCLLHSSNDSIK